MGKKSLLLDAMKPFHDSMIWQLNRAYYKDIGIDAWSSGAVPHNITSNSYVGKTYASLIYAMLKDLARKSKLDKVYIIELGSGHARLCFHVLKHLDKMVGQSAIPLPDYCFVLSDIVEKNLEFFADHPQLMPYYSEGKCDYTYFDAMGSDEIQLRHSKINIKKGQLDQLVIVIGNYFFDSIPQDLYHIQNQSIVECYLELSSKNENIQNQGRDIAFDDIDFRFEEKSNVKVYDDAYLNEILEGYKMSIVDSHILFPDAGLKCLETIRKFSTFGMMVLSMDKGFHLLSDIDYKPLPDFVTHGSFSFQVNYHAFEQYCKNLKGHASFPEGSNFHVELACLLCVPSANTYVDTIASYEKNVNEFGPDDYYGMTKNHYTTMGKMSMKDMLYLIRFSAFDSMFFYNILPSFKKSLAKISNKERVKIGECLRNIWEMYFNIKEPFDLAFELGGMFFDLGYYEDALSAFDHSIEGFGLSEDVSYNKALCFFQLNRDKEFIAMIKATEMAYPNFERVSELKQLLN